MSCQACIRAGLVCDALGCATWSKVMGECTGQLEKGSAVLKAAKVTLDRETHAREAAEAELRETAGELEKCSACLAVERRAHTLELTEATALLERCSDEMNYDEFDDPVQRALQHDVGAFLSRAPAQPAAPTPVREYTWDGYALPMMPAAPEPSAERAPATLGTVTANLLWVNPSHHVDVRERLAAAEAQLEAMRSCVLTIDGESVTLGTLYDKLVSLTPAPSPGAGKDGGGK